MDYAALSADDPGGDINTAFDTLKVMTETKALSERYVTVLTYASAYGMTNAEAVRAKIEANWPAWVHDAFQPNNGGINICDAETQAVITAQTPAVFTTEERDNMLALASETVLKYPGLRVGDVVHARG